MVLFLLHKLIQYTINISSFSKLVHVLWVLISYFYGLNDGCYDYLL